MPPRTPRTQRPNADQRIVLVLVLTHFHRLWPAWGMWSDQKTLAGSDRAKRLERGSPLPLVRSGRGESARGLAQSKTLRASHRPSYHHGSCNRVWPGVWHEVSARMPGGGHGVRCGHRGENSLENQIAGAHGNARPTAPQGLAGSCLSAGLGSGGKGGSGTLSRLIFGRLVDSGAGALVVAAGTGGASSFGGFVESCGGA